MGMDIKKLADLYKRTFVSFITLLIIGLLVWFSTNPVIAWVLVSSVCLLTAAAVWEYANLVKSKGFTFSSFLMIVVAVCLVISFYLVQRGLDFPDLPVLVLALGAGVFFITHFRDSEDALVHIAVEFFGVCYVAIPISFMLGILFQTGTLPLQDGRCWLFYLIAVTKVTDIGAYFVGRLWGKRRLAPNLSPRKTVEGALAGFVCAIITSLGLASLGTNTIGPTFNLTMYHALLLGILMGIFGQIGDLSESLLKRDAAVKDSNKLPGFGGVLDMIDSLIFTAPIVYFFLKWHLET
ncbi:MAG TPA: phosphatidate cytidylyltransferase [Rhabdochlamydiaceae bacterium]|nr:phosphatidate cytidylyltransferase [Rhabdochlamydiaceae bacterium]